MNKTFFLFPLRFENLIYLVAAYGVGLILILIFENTIISNFVLSILKFSYPISSIVLLVMMIYICFKEKKKIKSVIVPITLLIGSWLIIYYLIYVYM